MQSWVFLGNPGAGKSTLANCLALEPIFPAGLSLGSGKTSRVQSAQRDGIQYIDTPGLADATLHTTAKTEITKALQLAAGGACKLFFVATLRSGRVRGEDVATMNTILSSITVSDVPFAVIFNHVQREQYKRLMEGGAELQAVTASICSGPFTTPFILFVPELPQLSEEENALVELPLEIVRVFREHTPSFLLDPAVVQPIPEGSNTFRSLVNSAQNLINTYTCNNQAADAKIQALTLSKPTFWDTLYTVAMLGVKIWLTVTLGIN